MVKWTGSFQFYVMHYVEYNVCEKKKGLAVSYQLKIEWKPVPMWEYFYAPFYSL